MSLVPNGSRYLVVAAICMISHNLIVIGGDAAGIPMPVAVTISFCIVVLIGFVLHSRYTFSVKGDVRSLLRYTAAMALNLPLNIALLWLLFEQLHWPMLIASPVATLVLLIVNFFASRWAIAGRDPKGRAA
jgi:putative flippase GtrA